MAVGAMAAGMAGMAAMAAGMAAVAVAPHLEGRAAARAAAARAMAEAAGWAAVTPLARMAALHRGCHTPAPMSETSVRRLRPTGAPSSQRQITRKAAPSFG